MTDYNHLDASKGDPLFRFDKALARAMELTTAGDDSRVYHFNTTSPRVNGLYRETGSTLQDYFRGKLHRPVLPSFMPIDGGTSRAFHMILEYLAADVRERNKETEYVNRRYGYSLPPVKPVIVMPVPTYGHFFRLAYKHSNIELVTIERRRNHGWDVGTQELDKLFTQLARDGKRVVAYFDSNPNNPTGYVRDEAATRALATVIKKHSDVYEMLDKHLLEQEFGTPDLFSTDEYLAGDDDIAVLGNHYKPTPHIHESATARIRIIDDIVYDGLEYKNAPQPFAFGKIPDMSKDCFTITSPSKLGLAGMRAGLIIGDDRDTHKMQQADKDSGYCPSVMTLNLLASVFNDAAENTTWRTAYLKKATSYYRYAGLLVKALINGIEDVLDDVTPSMMARMEGDICRAKNCSAEKAWKLLEHGIKGVKVITSPQAGFFHLVDFSRFKGRRYEHGYSRGENAETFETEENLERHLQEKFNLSTASGDYTGMDVKDCIRRITFAQKPKDLIDMVDRLRGISQSFLPVSPATSVSTKHPK